MTPRAIFNMILVGTLVTVAAVKYHEASVSPNPNPEPTPGPVSQRFVLLTEETSDRSKLPKGQLEILTSQDVRDFLAGVCQSRKWDVSLTAEEIANESEEWRDMFAGHYSPPPGIDISNGRKHYSGPLPKDVEELKSLLRKYGVK